MPDPISREDTNKESCGTLKPGEPHPASSTAIRFIKEYEKYGGNLFELLDAFSSCAIEGNRMAEICAETLDRLLNNKPISDRYIMGLAWSIYEMHELKMESIEYFKRPKKTKWGD